MAWLRLRPTDGLAALTDGTPVRQAQCLDECFWSKINLPTQTESLKPARATYSCTMHRHVFTAGGFSGMSLLLRHIWPATAGTTLRFVRE